MIARLRGKVIEAYPNRLVVDVQGVGYEVHVSLSTWYEIEKRPKEAVRLFIHTHMREDGIALFGFWTEREKLLFERGPHPCGIEHRGEIGSIGDPVISQLYGKVAQSEFGLFVTLGTFTSQAVQFARAKHGPRTSAGQLGH